VLVSRLSGFVSGMMCRFEVVLQVHVTADGVALGWGISRPMESHSVGELSISKGVLEMRMSLTVSCCCRAVEVQEVGLGVVVRGTMVMLKPLVYSLL